MGKNPDGIYSKRHGTLGVTNYNLIACNASCKRVKSECHISRAYCSIRNIECERMNGKQWIRPCDTKRRRTTHLTIRCRHSEIETESDSSAHLYRLNSLEIAIAQNRSFHFHSTTKVSRRKSDFECKPFKATASCNTVNIEIERSECATEWNLRSGNNGLEFVYEFAVTSHIVADDDRNFVYTCAPSCEQQNNIAHCVKRHLIGISQKQRTVFSLVNIYLACKCFNLSSFIFCDYLLGCRRAHVAIIKYKLHCGERRKLWLKLYIAFELLGNI